MSYYSKPGSLKILSTRRSASKQIFEEDEYDDFLL